MSKMHKIMMPIRYEINAGQCHITDDGTPIWIIDYKEYFTEEIYFKAKPDSVKTYNQIGFNLKWDDETFMASFKAQGPQDQITAILASEFLGRSIIGTLCFNDLIGLMITKLTDLGGKIAIDQPDEEPP